MRIFYINRDVDSDRREMMKAALQETGIEAERVPGVDGYDAPDWLAAFYDRKMPPGESGCSASHLLVSSKIIAENLPWAVVLEDDARPKAGFLQAVLERCGRQCACRLGCNSPDATVKVVCTHGLCASGPSPLDPVFEDPARNSGAHR